MPIYRISREIGTILLVTLLLAVLGNSLSPRGIALVGDWDTRLVVVSARAKDDVVHRELEIKNLQTAKAIFDQGDHLFVDARREADYQAGHIQGAVSLPVHRFEEHIGDFWETHPMETKLVIYCSGRLCEDSHHLAQLLLESGFQTVRVLTDGFDPWMDAGYPVE